MCAAKLAPASKIEPPLLIPSLSPIAADDGTKENTATVPSVNLEVFEALFLEYKERICRYQFSLVENIEDAHDLTQKTFIKAWEKLSTLRDESRFSPWLYTIARNVACDYWRSKKKILLYLSENFIEQQNMMGIQGPEEIVEMSEIIKLALASLTPKYRACLLLSTVYGFSTAEIARFVGISKESVTTYLCSARSQFRQAYLQLKREQYTAFILPLPTWRVRYARPSEVPAP
ncbi:MAG: sigma-70 family RNA polymerase sigma factor [Ktedonobacteraceae bacterium]|nr:sigma-70 family RNA polymerase sigma factor [Ktedonobacteraceae bacterium]